jgi:threonine synthase
VQRGVIGKTQRVVCISTAHGLKFTEFKVRYHESQLEQIKSARANPAVILPPDYDRVNDAIRQRFAQS